MKLGKTETTTKEKDVVSAECKYRVRFQTNHQKYKKQLPYALAILTVDLH